MGYERTVLARARARYDAQVEAHRHAQQAQQEEIYAKLPRVAQLDREIRGTMAEVMAYAFRHGQDPSEAVARVKEKNQALQEERALLLETSGYGAAYLTDGPLCRRCGDTGYVGQTMCTCLSALCQEEQRKELTSLLSVRSSSFDDFSLDRYSDQVDPVYGISPRRQMELIYDSCVDYARKFSRKSKNLLMNGGTGLGKTFLSACIASEVITHGCSVVYDTAIGIFSAMERCKFGSAGPDDQLAADRVLQCDLLILDDLGTEMPTSFIPSALYAIVNGRLLAGLPTIISTNLSLEDLSRRYSGQIASRLMGEYINLVFLGQDIRLQSG